jgi:glutamate racemase
MDTNKAVPILGVFDSGVGGLSVLRSLWREMPGVATIYLADQAHVPYGPRPLKEVLGFSETITSYLIQQGADLIVVACNTASAAALHRLRQRFPTTPFVGMEPAVKPAAETTQTGVVGVLATPATFQGALYASVVERFGSNVTLLQNTCPGLVQQIEAGRLEAPETRAILEQALLPMLDRNIDTVVLGCTHYPFVIPLIQNIVGPQVRVIDPAPAVARQTHRLALSAGFSLPPGQFAASPGQKVLVEQSRFLTTAEPERFKNVLPLLLGAEIGAASSVERLGWGEKSLLWAAPG